MIFRKICDWFRDADRRIKIVESGTGVLCGIPEGGRILACAFGPDDDSLFFIHPDLEEILKTGREPVSVTGAPGGDRVRFAPEYAFAWEGKERDTDELSNYRLQENEEPGRYSLELNNDTLIHRTAAVLRDSLTGTDVSFEVERNTRPEPCPIAKPDGVRYTGYRSDTSLVLDKTDKGSTLGLWFLLQIPVGYTLIVPLKKKVPPTLYFRTGKWKLRDTALVWQYGGTDKAKVGYGTKVVTGRSAVLSPAADNKRTLIIREFPVRQDMYYCDAVSKEAAGDQVLQAWDGFGFGEMEYHAPATGASPLPKEIEDSSALWAFEGTEEQIREIGRELLGVSL